MDQSPAPDYTRPPIAALQGPAMSIGKVVLIVVAATFSGLLVGGLIGLSLGFAAPDFYRSALNGGAGMDPIQMGIGLGVSEGLALGFVLGIVIVLVQAFGRRRV